jgi:O-antigen ligase
MNVYKIFLSLTLILNGLTDLIRVVNLGGITALGAMTILVAPCCWLLIFSRYKLPKITLLLSWLCAFIIIALISWLWHYSQLSPVMVVQNLFVYLAFIGFLVLSTVQSHRSQEIPEYISQVLPKAIQISVGLYSLSLLMGGPGTGRIMGARAFALFAIIGVSWYLAVWRYRLDSGLKWTILTILTIAFSFSRTALLIALILVPLSQISLTNFKGWLRMSLTILLIITVSYSAFNYVEPIRSRFTQVGDNATVGGVQINTSGRSEAWPITYSSAMESPLIGKGPGSVGVMLKKRVGSAFTHPHNDYLRLFHDFGVIGLGLWLLGYGQLMIKTWQNWQWSDKYDKENAHIHLASFLALVAVAVAMITDNVIVYIFVMAPLGIMVGASLGIGSRRRKEINIYSQSFLVNEHNNKFAIKY